MEHPKAKDIVLEAMEEHHLVDDIVEQLKDTPFDDEHWGAKLKVTKENVEHHIEEEEDGDVQDRPPGLSRRRSWTS
ncbi:MAG TPA: hypothetical protein VIN70_05310 [Candidatus Limnocylindria bacterium]|jgi:predicted DNA-binding protein